MHSPHLLVHREGPLTWLTFHLPQKKNPLTASALEALHAAVHAAATDDSRVLILRGAGGNFSAGASLDPADGPDPRVADVTGYLKTQVHPLILAMRRLPKPIVAQVEGVAVGVGLSFALAADCIVATPTARLSPIFTRIGISSDGGCSWFLAQHLGYQRAFQALAFAEMLSGAQAHELGIVNQLAEPDAIEAATNDFARRLAQGPYVAIQQTKRNLNTPHALAGLAAALDAEAEHQAANFAAADFAEGVMAFLQKRPPNWQGR